MNAMGKPFHPQAEAWFCGRLFVKVSLHHSEHGAVKYQADKSRYQIVITVVFGRNINTTALH